MTAPTIAGPTPIVGWEANRSAWLAARRKGLGASDVAAILGFSDWHTPWQVWAEKLDVRRPEDQPSDAADLGNALEPWLLDQATILLGQPATNTDAQLYAHPEHPWRMCSPDGVTIDGHTGIECKTAGIASGFGPPRGWDDGGTPLGYELQCRWILHVMGWERIELIALVANLGLIRRTIIRDLTVEADLVAQASDWWQRHIIGRVEPPLGAADNNALADLYPHPTIDEIVDLDGTAALNAWVAYREARAREKSARKDKEASAAVLKALMRDAWGAKLDGHLIATWGEKAGHVDWPRLVADLAETAGVTPPGPDMYRKPSTRTLSVKDPT